VTDNKPAITVSVTPLPGEKPPTREVLNLRPTYLARAIAQFLVFELDREGSNSHLVREPFDLLAITNTTWEREKAAGADSSDLRPIWLRR